jgi:hypothetical protein
MRSYGETQLSIAQFSAGTVRVLGVYSAPAVFPRILLSIGWLLRDIPPHDGQYAHAGLTNYALVDFRGELALEGNGLVLGSIQWADRRHPIPSNAFSYETTVAVTCDLDERRLERYEEHRNGGRAQFVLVLWPVIERETKRLECGEIRLSFPVPRDDWVDILGNLRHDQYDVLEIRRPIGSEVTFRGISSELTTARTRIDKGEYNAALGSCRTALEQTIQGVRSANEDKELKELFVSRTDPKRGEWYTTIISRAKDLASRAIHHPNESLQYSRSEAMFVLRTVESSIALLGQFFGIDGISE